MEAGGASAAGEKALETLCRLYWQPVYVFVRRRGHSPHEAQDLTQEFFAALISGDSFQRVDPEKGRFRTFLLASMNHFLANEWRNARREKRGGGRQIVSWDEFDPEERSLLDPAAGQSPEEDFDRRWARTVVFNALTRLEQEARREGNEIRFEALKSYLQTSASNEETARAAQLLGLSEQAVKSAIHRMRKRYAEIVREEIGQTVGAQTDVEGELRYLVSILSQ